MMQGKYEAPSTPNPAASNKLIAFMWRLFKRQPLAASRFTAILAEKTIAVGGKHLVPGAVKDKKVETYLGQEIIKLLQDLNPGIHTLTRDLLATKPGASIDEIFEAIKPALYAIYNQKLTGYGVSLNDLEIQEFLTESYIKSQFLPIFTVLRDIPKFCKSMKDKNILGKLADIKAQLINHLEHDFHVEIRKCLRKSKDGLYPINTSDPALVSQVKTILNALQHAKQALKFINSLDLNPDNGFRLESFLQKKGPNQVEFMTKIIWYLAVQDSPVGDWMHFNLDFDEQERQFIHDLEQTIQNVRQAQSSLLEIDIPLYQVFGQEIKALSGIIQSLRTMSALDTNTVFEQKLKDAERIAETAGDYIGKPLGVFVDQLKPHMGKTDYSFLIRHSGLLPGYLDQLTQLIQVHGAGNPSAALALSESDKEAFRNSAINLFLELGAYGDFNPFQKAQSLLFPIRREVAALSQGAYQQALRVNAATGDMVVYQLSRVKDDVFAQLLCEADKMELYLGFAPGVLSKTVMKQVNDIYQTLVMYANSVIDLKASHPDLLQLDNTSFLTQRLQHILQEKNNCELKINSAKEAKRSLALFMQKIRKYNGDLNDAAQDEMVALNQEYQQFKSYVIQYNPRLSVTLGKLLSSDDESEAKQIWHAAEYNAMDEAVKILCDKDIATFKCYLDLSDSQLLDLPKQVKGHLYALDPQEAHSILIINELRFLKGRLAEHRSDKKEHQFMTDFSSLEPGHRAQLYDYHRTRSLTLQFIHLEIEAFLTKLRVSDWLTDPKQITAMIERYRVIQPYLVDALSTEKRCDIDQSFVAVLIQLAHGNRPEGFSTIMVAMKNSLQALDTTINEETERSNKRQLLFSFAHQQAQEEKTMLSGHAPLTLESELVQRQDKWIRHRRFSRAATEMKDTLYNLLTHLDPALKLSKIIKPSENSVPFPEMESDLDALATPSQVSWIKRTLNVVHYLNSSFEYLESLDRDIHKKDISQYFLKGPLIEGVYQIKPYIELTKAYQTFMELLEEPAGQTFFYILKDSYSEIRKVWEQLGPLYSVRSQDVQVENKEPVQSGGLWYPMLSMLVLPEHLQAVSAGEAYGPLQAKPAQQKAKELSQYIQEVTNEFQSSQYCQLLLRSPYVISKFLPELKAKLDQFRQGTHEVTLTHLIEIQATLQSLLIEADAWELKLGLRAGLITRPMKLILDKLFNSFIEPLGINLQQRGYLLTNVSSFDKRLAVIEQKQQELESITKSETRTAAKISQFLQVLEHIKNRLDLKQTISSEEEVAFTEQYFSIYPLLQSQQRRYEIAMDQRDKSVELDEFCKRCLDTKITEESNAGHLLHYPQLKDILYLVKHVHAAKKGNLNTLNMKKEQLKAESILIRASREQHAASAKHLVNASIEQAIDTQIATLCMRTNQSVYLKDDYTRELIKSLDSKKRELLAKTNTIPLKELDRVIATELRQQLERFSKNEYLQLCHLEGILSQIEHFIAYCEKEKSRFVFENIDTFNPKIDLLNRLKSLATDKNLSVNYRLEKIKEEAKKPTFKTILMAHERHLKFDLKTLERIFLDLFHFIFNFFGYGHRPQELYQCLEQEIKTHDSSDPKALVARVGMFPAERGYQNSVASVRVKQDVNPDQVPATVATFP